MISGIICEFNPFHAGHTHLIDHVKCHPGDAVVCVMSGNFVQRGTFAVYDKRARTETALKGGADLVLELPTAYATRSAEGFARAAREHEHYRPLALTALDYAREGITSVDEVLRLAEDLG